MINLRPLGLDARPESWRLFLLRKADPAFQAFSRKVFERDHHTCGFCGFCSRQYQEVINLDNNYHNNKLSNMITACCFCAQCFFLDAVGKDDYGGGVLIYLPEVKQNDLNGFCHVLFCAMSNATVYRVDAQNIYRSLKLRSQIVEKQLGEGLSDPALFGQAAVDLPIENKELVWKTILRSVRLLPSPTKFTQQVYAWSKNSLEELSRK